ncbi:phenylalanine--tRNA ligase subunit beta [Candidatus Saccharibacteria bacterium]|nr:phenylalanine--tRNA ligase subunit beta [Candidatus Saccharibacteria bacterium]
MKISLNWLKKYVDIPISDDELIKLIGARLVEVEGVIDETHKYDNIYVVRVETVEKIPETHLTCCQINVGMAPFRGLSEVTTENEGASDPSRERSHPTLVQVVCGAPNVREGMLAVWIAPGAIVPASVHEDAPFVIGKRKMQGYESNGMLAGADELDFGDDHSGIVEIDPALAKPGDLLADVFELKDLILDIENKSLTHRPDCFGIIGFAREVAGILGQKFEEPEFLTHEEVFPEGFLKRKGNGLISKDCNIEVEITDAKICPRYTAATINVNEGALRNDKYLTLEKILLAKSGMFSRSKIVDVTNYLMLLTGQPLHAFDLDKFIAVGKTEDSKVVVRLAKNDEKLVLLDDTEVGMNENDIVITSNDVPVALAGAMGGKSTEIDENTKRVLLESATFSLYNLRKTQMSHGIFSEAITRFTKGVPATGTFNVLAEAVKEIGGKPLDLNDNWPSYHSPIVVKVSASEINSLLGTDYTYKKIEETLKNVGFTISCDCGKKDACECEYINVAVPTWRTDIHIKEDVIEEIGRLLGYDNIQPALPLHGTANKDPMLEFKREIRGLMSRFGANELLTYSFVSERLLEKVGQDLSNSYKIINSISPELQYIRQSIVPSLLEKAYMNEKMPVEKFAIYEMNKVYQKEWGMNEEGVPNEKMQLGFVVAERKNNETAFYKAKYYAAKLLSSLQISAEFVPFMGDKKSSKLFEPKRTAEILVDGVRVGLVGEFKKSVKHNFKLADYLAGFELDLDLLLEHRSKKQIRMAKLVDKRDVTITSDRSYAEVLKEFQGKYPEAEIIPGVVYQPEGQKEKNLTFHLNFYES